MQNQITANAKSGYKLQGDTEKNKKLRKAMRSDEALNIYKRARIFLSDPSLAGPSLAGKFSGWLQP